MLQVQPAHTKKTSSVIGVEKKGSQIFGSIDFRTKSNEKIGIKMERHIAPGKACGEKSHITAQK